MAFWSESFADKEGTFKDPKRQFRFTVEFQGLDAPQGGGTLWYAKSAAKPKFEITETEHRFLNHTFYYPSSLKWESVEIVMVDPVEPDVGATLSDIVTQSGYAPPTDANSLSTMSKAKAVGALGTVLITQVDAEGNMVEAWTLWNAWIKSVDYGALAYDNEDLSEVTLTLMYDWARIETSTPSVALAGGGGTEFFSV